MQRLLIVEDDEDLRSSLASALGRRCRSLEVRTAADAAQAIEALAVDTFHLLVTDLRMPGIGGVELIMEVRSRHPALPIVVISAHVGDVGEPPVAEAAPISYLEKPFDLEDFYSLVAHFVEMDRCVGPQTLAEVARLYRVARLTGRVDIICGDARGTARFEEGRMEDAELGALHGTRAIHELVKWGDARFEMHREAPHTRDMQSNEGPRNAMYGGRKE